MSEANHFNTVELNGKSLTIEKIVDVARNNAKVQLADSSKEKIINNRIMLDKKVANKEIMYGINTGIGEFSEIVLNDEQTNEFQKYLVYNHSAGIGEPAPIEHIRADQTVASQLARLVQLHPDVSNLSPSRSDNMPADAEKLRDGKISGLISVL